MLLRCRIQSPILFGLFVLSLTCLGCDGESTSGASSVGKRPGPEASFADIVLFVKGQIETGAGGMPSGFVTESGGRRSQFIVRNDVSSELIPPAKAGDSYRGTITITSRSTYSIRVEEGGRADEASKSDDSQVTQQRSLLDEAESTDAGMVVLDPDLVASGAEASGAPADQSTTSVARREAEDVRTFDFAFEQGRWVLKSETDPETERAVQRAFDRALEMQP